MLIAGGALRTMRLMNNTTSNYHLDARHACAAREHGLNTARRISPEPGFSRVLSDTLGNARLHAIDAAFLDTILNYELIIYTTWRDRAQLLLEIRHAPND